MSLAKIEHSKNLGSFFVQVLNYLCRELIWFCQKGTTLPSRRMGSTFLGHL